jgi:hypothetical protein
MPERGVNFIFGTIFKQSVVFCGTVLFGSAGIPAAAGTMLSPPHATASFHLDINGVR